MLRKQDISVVLCIAAVSLTIMLTASLSAQNRIRHWQDYFTSSSENPTHIATNLLHEMYRFEQAATDYLLLDNESSKERMELRFDIFWSRINLLEVHKARFSVRPETYGIEILTPDSHTSVLMQAMGSLLKIGKPNLALMEQFLYNDQLSKSERHDGINVLLKEISQYVSVLNTYALERDRYLEQVEIELSEQLRLRLWHAYFCIGLGIALVAFALIRRWREKVVSAANLKRINARLRMKIRESERLTDRLKFQASHDLLSGLHNRQGFKVELEALLNTRTGTHGLCFVDMDMFKIVNDTAGHAAGDALIQQVAAVLKHHAPTGSIVGRFGGDEFLILMPDCEPNHFRNVVESCCRDMQPLEFLFKGQRFDVTASFGAVHFRASEHSLKSVMDATDAACYEAKRAGGGRVKFHADGLAVEARRKDLEWVSKIQQALSNDNFCLYKQRITPIQESHDTLESWELLIRMTADDGRVLLPGPILQVAERYGLATRIDRWVVRQAFALLNENSDDLSFDHVNINLSGLSVSDPQFLRFITKMTETLSVDARIVCFEITETAVVGQQARDSLLKLKSLGYQIALDDFGSGFSSFGYLESLPVDYIKIDGMFVLDIDTNPTHREFVKAISTVAKAMGKKVVAEFVENERSATILQELGVDFVQGHYVGYPEVLINRPLVEEPAAPIRRLSA